MLSLAGFHLWPCSCLAPLLLAFLRPSFQGFLGLDMIPDSRGPAMGQVTEVSFSAAEEIPSDLNHKKEQCWPPTRQSLWIFCVALLVLGVTAAVMGLGITFGMPIKPANMPHQQCKTAPQQFGFLCEDLTTCLPPSLLCDGKLDCSHGEDESATYCGQLPSSLPQNLIFKCPNQKTWTYVDKVCDTRNDCGDCSDESVLQCLECSGWSCDTVSFADCACIPRTRKNGIQDCADWSDENLCE